jgi:ribonuclease HI
MKLLNKCEILQKIFMGKKAKQKYYVVWKGVKPGIYKTWAECRLQVDGYKGAIHKSFDSRVEALSAYNDSPVDDISRIEKKSRKAPMKSEKTFTKKSKSIDSFSPLVQKSEKRYITESLAVDAACSGNPGDVEYRGVYVETGQQLFHVGPMKQGTNNIGEFLALVHGLAYLKKNGSNMPIYTDSHNAMLWVKQKKCKTKLVRTTVNEPIFNLIARAEKWLNENDYDTKILKWETSKWGEIPADFGRK